MSDTILSTDLTVYYLDENRQNRIEWTGSATGTRTLNEVYSALQDLFDEPLQSDNGTPMSAETPVEYTIGNIDSGAIDPWYISYDCMQHLTGGALKSAAWTHTDGTATGIVIVPVTSNTITTSEYGLDISGATTGNGTLLEILHQPDSTEFLVIRPDTNGASDNFTTASQVITSNALTATQSGAVANTGEQIWANLYNVTPIEADTHVYMYQGLVSDATRARIYGINQTAQDWWPEGAFDRCFYTNDPTDATLSTIDGGNITVLARKGNTLYDSFEVQTSTTSGGRNPVPLSASADGNNTTGYKAITVAGGTGNFTVGDEIEGDVSTARGIITLIVNPGATATYHYYLIADPQVDFDGSEAITNNDDTGAATSSGAVSAQGPALASWFDGAAFPTVVHTATTFDIDDDATAEGWSIEIDCNQASLAQMYEWAKYVTRNGETGTTPTDGVEGEQYVGNVVYLEWSGTVSGTMTEGNDVTQAGTLATGIIVSSDETLKQMTLRDVRGTFDTSGVVTDNDASGTVTPDTTATTFNAVKSAPFGSLAGGRFFGARGVLLSDYKSAEENDFQLIDNQGVGRTRPISISITISNLVGGAETETDSDTVAAWRLTAAGGSIDKTEYSAAGGEAVGDATLVVDTAITADTPGKTAGGVLHIRDFSDTNKQYRLRYDSWSTSTFTLSNVVIASADAATTTTIQETGAFTTAKRGDLVLNLTQGDAVSYITQVVDNDNCVIDPPISGQGATDNIEINAIPVIINTLDDVYVAIIDEIATGSTASASLVYVSQLDYRVVVRNQRNATKIKPFTTDDVTTGTDRSVATIRTTDTIAT